MAELTTSGVIFGDSTSQTTAAIVSTSTVLAATAGASAGAIGTYAFLGRGSAEIAWNGTVAGSGLYPSGLWKGSSYGTNGTPADNNGDAWQAGQNTPQAGTWRCMGRLRNTSWSITVMLRIS